MRKTNPSIVLLFDTDRHEMLYKTEEKRADGGKEVR